VTAPVIMVAVPVSMRDYPKLARLAERRGFDTIAAMLAASLDRLANITDAHDETEFLVRLGLSDAEIAAHLNLIVGTVADRRRRLGLAPNRRHHPQRRATS